MRIFKARLVKEFIGEGEPGAPRGKWGKGREEYEGTRLFLIAYYDRARSIPSNSLVKV